MVKEVKVNYRKEGMEEEVNFNYNTHVTPISSISLKPKTLNIFNLSNYQKFHPFSKQFFKETR